MTSFTCAAPLASRSTTPKTPNILSPNLDTQPSPSWAGAVASASEPTLATMEWNEPADSTIDDEALFWAGIGGWNDSNLIQTGTEMNDGAGLTYHQFWYESWPSETIQPVSAPTVVAGDDVAVQVRYEGGIAFFTDCNMSNNTCSNYSETVPSPGATAECVAERPLEQPGSFYFPLSNFGTVVFTNCIYGVGENPVAVYFTSGNSWPVDMVNSSGQVLASSPGPDSSGPNLAVTWHLAG
ncbi:hypothetical protein HII28_19475 [Planctomonas sp. JC2975]|uniref:G1 family glutamic endopeptidase n=1 Tax=Planctomonas sp. JC2975 TaxID=2729626 RepID=UPI0014739B76|nr:hypothetical protein [Planctomonas sp. JC2975]